MIIANITSDAGRCLDAEHSYCFYIILNDVLKNREEILQHVAGQHDEELRRDLTDEQRAYLRKKDDGYVGRNTNRFDNIKQIHDELLKQFPDEDIVTFEDGEIFQGMLCKVDNIFHDHRYFGKIWMEIPNALYKKHIPENIDIACENCGHKYTLQDIIKEERIADGQDWVQFKNAGRVGKCCKHAWVMWDAVI